MAIFLKEKWIGIEKHPDSPDGVCYVPIHKQKRSKRGYNQSEIIAKEIANALSIPLLHILERNTNIETQTHFGRMDRLKNQEGSIGINSD